MVVLDRDPTVEAGPARWGVEVRGGLSERIYAPLSVGERGDSERAEVDEDEERAGCTPICFSVGELEETEEGVV